jgi:hypothetical protein
MFGRKRQPRRPKKGDSVTFRLVLENMMFGREVDRMDLDRDAVAELVISDVEP